MLVVDRLAVGVGLLYQLLIGCLASEAAVGLGVVAVVLPFLELALKVARPPRTTPLSRR
jgi:hypothetical protein